LRTLLSITLLAAASTACFKPSFDACAVTCGADQLCPDGMTCLGDGMCHRSASEALCAARPDADPNQPDADPDRADAGPPVTPTEEGQLVITELMIDSVATPEQAHEWVEIFNPSDSVSYELQGMWVADSVLDIFEFDSSVIVRPGEHIVLGESDDLGSNGGVAVDYDWPDADFNLSNDADEVILYNPDLDVYIDEVDYGATWFAEGAALSLDPDSKNAVDNDAEASWCDATTAFGTSGDLGTPGAANPDC